MSNPLFFLHIPRTGGTTLNSILESHFAPEEILRMYKKTEYERHRSLDLSFLGPIKLITGHLLLEHTDPPSIYGIPVRVVTFLRDPMERLASEYAFLRSWKQNHLYQVLNDKNVSFAEYLQSRDPRLFYRGKNFMTRCISGMSFRDEPYPADAVAKAKRNLQDRFLFFGLQERFTESLVLLSEMLNLSNMLHERRNALKNDSRPSLTEEDIALAEKLNQGDREVYAFASALFAERIAALERNFAVRVKQFEFLNNKFQKISRLLQEKTTATHHDSVTLPKDIPW